MNFSNNSLDDLTIIKGIGPARQRWLKESLDVHTFGDLAALSVGEIESRLKSDKQIASRETIKVWIAEADRRAAKVKRAEKRSRTTKDSRAKDVKASDEKDETNLPPIKPIGDDDNGKAHSSTRRDGWRPFASFVVEYQERTLEGKATEYRTTVHYMEADISTNWPGIEREQHCYWMLEQIGDRISSEPIQELAKEEGPTQKLEAQSRPMPRLPVNVEIAQIRAFQSPQVHNLVGTGKPHQPFEGHLLGNVPFALEILFNLIGEGAAYLAEEKVVFRARAYVQDQTTGKSTNLGDVESGRLVQGELAYAAIVPNITLPAGSYRLFATVTLEAESVKPDFAMLSEFKVGR